MTAICADNTTDIAIAIFLFIYFSKNLDIGLLKITMPKVPKYESCKPISFIAKGLSISVINKETAKAVKVSNYLNNNFAANIIIAIIQALITDGVKFVRHINIDNTNIVIIYVLLFDNLLFCNMKVIPKIIYPTCVPDMARI